MATADGALSLELLNAVQNEGLDSLQRLVTAGADAHALHQTLYQSLVFFATTRPVRDGKNDRVELLELLVERYGLDAAGVDAIEQTALFYAAREGDVKACRYLIKQGCEPDHLDSNRQSPIFYAAKSGDRACVELLLEKRCEADRPDMNKQTPLFYADSAPVTALLLQVGCDPNRRDIEGVCPVFFAAAKGKADLVQLLVANRADVNMLDTAGTSCLFHAAKSGQVEMCQLLVETYKVNPTRSDHSGRTARMMADAWNQRRTAVALEALERRRKESEKKAAAAKATKRGVAAAAPASLGPPAAMSPTGTSLGKQLYDAVRDAPAEQVVRLLEARAQPEAVQVGGGENLVFVAAARAQGAHEMCALLVERRLDPTIVDTRLHQTPLFFAVRNGARAGGLECAQFLLSKRCSADLPDLRGETPLFYAAQRPDPGCAEALLAAGANAGHTNQFGGTAAFYAARAGAVACMSALLRARADANTCDQRGQTALWEAATAGFAALLLMHRCDANHRSQAGQTALMAAAEKGADDVVRAIVEGKGDADAKDLTGQTPLFYAARRGHARCCRYLLEECDAEPAHCDKDGASAADIATSGGHTAAASVIRERMAVGVRKRAAELGGVLSSDVTAPRGLGESPRLELGSPLGESPRLLHRAVRRRRTISFRDQDGHVIPPGSAEYTAALHSLLGMCPWLDGWGSAGR